MAQRRENHSGQSHKSGGTGKSSKTKKQFFRVQGERDVLWIRNSSDWARVHRTGVHLVCPDRGCAQRLVAHQNAYGTRYLSNHKDSTGCNHFVPAGGGGRMTDEHLWLQGKLREICIELGYDAELEVDVAGARVDLRVESAPFPFAFEVQRVSTDFTARRQAREQNGMRTLWLLPESDRQKNTAKGKRKRDPLFSEPSVRLGYRDGPSADAKVLTVDQLRSDVWQGDGSTEVHLIAGVTVGKLGHDKLSFRSSRLPLQAFLQQVLDGSREWYPQRAIQGANRGTWAGWLLGDDVKKYKAEVVAVREMRERREEAARAAAEEAAREKADREREARERQAAAARAEDDEARARCEREQREPMAPRDISGPREATDPALPPEPVRSNSRKPWWRRLLGFFVG